MRGDQRVNCAGSVLLGGQCVGASLPELTERRSVSKQSSPPPHQRSSVITGCGTTVIDNHCHKWQRGNAKS
ncbi:unnamed protein product, partial [Staurois parvus]